MPKTATLPSDERATKSREDGVLDQVFERLGRPKNLERATVRLCKSGCHARVNIWCRVPIEKPSGYFAAVRNPDIFDSRVLITDTFYCQLSQEGGIISSNPTIEQRYE